MKRTKSPNHPAITLENAIGLARKLYKREGRSTVKPEVAVISWGYNSLSGPASRRISSLRQYGLIGPTASGVQLTERALRILIDPKSSQKYIEALQDAALEPKIFQEIRDKYPEASDDALYSHLVIENKFAEKAASRVIKSYRANIAFAKLTEKDYTTRVKLEQDEHEEEKMLETLEKQYTRRFSWPLSKEVTAELRLAGTDITPSHIEKLRQYLELVKTAFEGESDEEGIERSD